MAPQLSLFDGLPCVQRDGKVMIRVPWDSADRLHERLLAGGVQSTLHLEPGQREAFLDLWDGAGAEQLRSLLAEFQAA